MYLYFGIKIELSNIFTIKAIPYIHIAGWNILHPARKHLCISKRIFNHKNGIKCLKKFPDIMLCSTVIPKKSKILLLYQIAIVAKNIYNDSIAIDF